MNYNKNYNECLRTAFRKVAADPTLQMRRRAMDLLGKLETPVRCAEYSLHQSILFQDSNIKLFEIC